MNIGSLVGYLGLDAGPFEKGLNGALGKLDGFASKGAVKAAAAGVAIAGAIGAGVVGAMNVEAANDKLTAQLGLTEAESERIGGIAGQLYANAYGDSLSDVNGAVASVIGSIGGMREASSADLQAVTANALDFATAMDVDVAGAAQTAGILLKTGLAADARGAFDLLTVAAQTAGPAMVEPVMEAANEYATHFAAIGMSGEQAMGLLVAASADGEIAVDKAGDAVKEFAIRATDGSTASGDAYKAIGLNANKMANDLLAGGETAAGATAKIVDGLLGIKDPAKQSQAAIALFGTPLEDIGVGKIPAFLTALQSSSDAMGDVAGAADRMGEGLNDNAATNIESFKRQAQTAFINVLGGKVLPAVNDVAKAVATNFGPALTTAKDILTGSVLPALQGVFGFLSQHKTTVTVIAGLIGTVLVGAFAVWAARATVAAATNTVAWFTTAAASSTSAAVQQRSAMQVVVGWTLMATRAVAQGVVIAAVWTAQIVAAAVTGAASFAVQAARVVAGWALMGAQSLVRAAQMAAAWVVAMGPIGWVIAAVVGLVALIIANWDTVVSWTQTAWNAVSGAISGAWNWITGIVTGAVAAVRNTVSGAWSWVRNTTTGAWNAVVSAVSGAWGRVTGAVSSGVSNVMSFVSSLPGRITGALSGLGSSLYNIGRNMIQGLLNGAGSLLRNIGNFFLDKVPGWIKGPFKAALGISSPSKVFAGYGVNIGEGLVNGLAAMRPAVAAEMMRMADTRALADLVPGMNRVQFGEVSEATWNKLLSAGWKGNPNDRAEALYRPADTAGPSGGGPLVHADQITIIEGTADDVARKLAVEARTGGLG